MSVLVRIYGIICRKKTVYMPKKNCVYAEKKLCICRKKTVYMPKKNCVYAEKKLEHFGIIWYNNSIEKFPAKKTFSMLILKHSQRSISMSIKPENEQNQKQV